MAIHVHPKTSCSTLSPLSLSLSLIINRQKESRLQVPEFPNNIESRTTRLLRVQITMTHYQRLRITLMQILQQHPQRTLLFLSACVLWSLAVGSQAADVANANAMAVVVLAVSTHLLFRTASLNTSVRRNDVVVATALPTKGTMIPVNVRHSKGTARPIGGAMHNNKRNLSHNINIFCWNSNFQQYNSNLRKLFLSIAVQLLIIAVHKKRV